MSRQEIYLLCRRIARKILGAHPLEHMVKLFWCRSRIPLLMSHQSHGHQRVFTGKSRYLFLARILSRSKNTSAKVNPYSGRPRLTHLSAGLLPRSSHSTRNQRRLVPCSRKSHISMTQLDFQSRVLMTFAWTLMLSFYLKRNWQTPL